MSRCKVLSLLAIGSISLLAACSTGSTATGDKTASEPAQPASASAAAAQGSSGEPIRIAVFELATANAYSAKNMEGVKKAAAETGAQVDIFDGAFDGSKQLTQIQDALATGKYQGLVVFANDGVAVVPGVEQANADGIPTVAAYAPIGSNPDTGSPQVDGVIGTVWHPNLPDGQALGDMTANACKTDHPDANPCKIAYLSGGNAVLFEQQKLKAFTAAMDASGVPYEIVAQQEGNFLVDLSRTATENILQANPDVNVISTSADQMTLGAEQALKDAEITGVTLVSVGASLEGVAAVQEGRWYGTTVFLPVDEGYLSAKMLLNAIAGTAPENPDINLVLRSTVGPVITKDNAANFQAQWSAVG